MEQRWRFATLIGVGAILVLALTPIGWAFENAFRQQAPNPDWGGWLASARTLVAPWADIDREPGHAYVIKFFLALVGDDERALRLSSIAETLVGFLFLVLVTRQFCGRLVTLGVAAVFIFNPVVVHYAIVGLREPLQSALGLALLWVSIWALKKAPARLKPKERWRRNIITGLVAAALGLTRVWTLAFALLVPVFVSLRRRLSLRDTAIFSSMSASIAILCHIPRWLNATTHTGSDVNYAREWIPQADGGLDFVALGLLTMQNIWTYFADYLYFFVGGRIWVIALVFLGITIDVARNKALLTMALILSIGAFLPLLHLSPAEGKLGIENRFLIPAFAFAMLLAGLGPQLLIEKWLAPHAPRWLAPALWPLPAKSTDA